LSEKLLKVCRILAPVSRPTCDPGLTLGGGGGDVDRVMVMTLDSRGHDSMA
jgi:hypothetical protein